MSLRKQGAAVATMGIAVALGIGLYAATGAGAQDAAEVSGEPRSERAIMRDVFGAISVLLPQALSADGFADPAAREKARVATEKLGVASSALIDHAEVRDDDFLERSRTLADDVEYLRMAVAMGRWDDVRFETWNLMDRCVGCHSRLADAAEHPLAERWLETPELADLERVERARLLVATRRFDDALALWEAAFVDPEVTPYELDVGEELSDYLAISLRVRRSEGRAIEHLEKLAARPGIPDYLERRLGRWVEALREVARDSRTERSPLAQARAWSDRAREWNELPTDVDGLPFELAASGLLLDWLGQGGADGLLPDQRAEAWYLLGLLEARTAVARWSPRTQVYMEAAVRSGPQTRAANRAYQRLEELVLLDYGVPRTGKLPRTERMRLEELASLATATGGAGSP